MEFHFNIEDKTPLHYKMMMWSSFATLITMMLNTCIIYLLAFSIDIKTMIPKNHQMVLLFYSIWFFKSLFTIKEIDKKTLLTHAPVTLPMYSILLIAYRILRKKYPKTNNSKQMVIFNRKKLIEKWGLK
jgi:cellulose synthase/poly-beta-1,6-N-acetylglucosamine synthase-like glycosyltransferase